MRGDGVAQCADLSDEYGCPATFTCPGSGECIAAEKRCDGVIDCADGADEAGCHWPHQAFRRH